MATASSERVSPSTTRGTSRETANGKTKARTGVAAEGTNNVGRGAAHPPTMAPSRVAAIASITQPAGPSSTASALRVVPATETSYTRDPPSRRPSARRPVGVATTSTSVSSRAIDRSAQARSPTSKRPAVIAATSPPRDASTASPEPQAAGQTNENAPAGALCASPYDSARDDGAKASFVASTSIAAGAEPWACAGSAETSPPSAARSPQPGARRGAVISSSRHTARASRCTCRLRGRAPCSRRTRRRRSCRCPADTGWGPRTTRGSS